MLISQNVWLDDSLDSLSVQTLSHKAHIWMVSFQDIHLLSYVAYISIGC